MSFLSALGLVIGLVSGGISLYEFTKNHKRRGTILAVTSIGILLAAYLVANPPFPSAMHGPGVNLPPPSYSPQPSTSSASGSATPSPTQAPTLPCIVNLSTWTNGSSDWKVLNGALLNDGTNDNASSGGPTINAPCQLGNIANYAAETKIQVTKVGRDPCFGITVRGNPTSDRWQGYKVGMGTCACCNTFTGGVFIGIPSYPINVPNPQAVFDPGRNLHTYRVEVKDNTIKFFIDGGLTFNITDNSYLTGSQVGLWCQNVQLEVTSFKVTAL